MTVTTMPMGPRAVLVENPPGGPPAWAAAVRASDVAGVIDIVPAARTVLVSFESESCRADFEGHIDDFEPGTDRRSGDVLVVPVRYDGPDLAAVAAETGLTTGEVADLHSGATYTVAFCGFAPGFGYLDGLPEALHRPRRASPRLRVPAGSVAIAAQFSAIYPFASPGGWHLIGSTDLVVFDVAREPPALLSPGTSVRFQRS